MTKGFMKGIATMLCVAVLAGGVCATGYASRNDDGKWFSNSDFASWHWTNENKAQPQAWGGVIDNVGNELNAETTYAMPAAMAFYSRTRATLAEQLEMPAPTVTVTCSHNFEFNNVFVDWSVEYPSGASAADVVTVTPADDGSLTATVTCKSAFDQPLTLKATLRGNEEKTATCTIDYVKRLIDTSYSVMRLAGGDFNDLCGVYFNPNYGVGTVTGNISVKSLKVYLDNDFMNALQSYLKFNINFGYASLSDIPLVNAGKDGLLQYEESYCWDYSMFISGFNDYDAAHKKAIYYAWFTAWNDNFGFKVPNLYYHLVLELSYNGAVIQTVSEYDLTGFPNASYLNGDCEGSELSPDLTLNTNIAL